MPIFPKRNPDSKPVTRLSERLMELPEAPVVEVSSIFRKKYPKEAQSIDDLQRFTDDLLKFLWRELGKPSSLPDIREQDSINEASITDDALRSSSGRVLTDEEGSILYPDET